MPSTAAEQASGAGDAERGHSVRSYCEAFAPMPAWEDLVAWPPDVFAVTNLILDHTQGYRFVIAPPSGRRWPPLPDWDERVRDAARHWREEGGRQNGGSPELVQRYWATVTRYRDVPLAAVRSGEAAELAGALLTLHAVADEACADVCSSRRPGRQSFENRAWKLLEERGTLSRLSPARVRIVPKTNFAVRGLTIRSLSRYLALCYESVDIRWRSVEPGPPDDGQAYNIVLVPWPLAVSARDFRPLPPALIENMDTERFGFFEFAPEPSLEGEAVRSLLAAARERAGRVDAVILPEAAIRVAEIPTVEEALTEHGATLLIAGVQAPPAGTRLGRNYLHFGVRTRTGWSRYEQDKHHRWCLDASQIRQYHLSRSLDPKKRWWEAIDLGERKLHVIDMGAGVTTVPLVCEDFAQADEIADLVRRLGPSLVVAVLLDGPQLQTRWPSRYSSVLIDDPGSAVLTLAPYGMVARCRPLGMRHSRVVAHWNSRDDGIREIELAPRAGAILLSTTIRRRTLWTADGRRHDEAPGLDLTGIHQLRTRAGTTAGR